MSVSPVPRLLPLLLLLGCAATRAQGIPVETPCPPTPNCVGSLDPDPDHHIAPLPLHGPPETAVERLAAVVLAFPRTTLVGRTDTTLSVVFTSALFRFDDDVSFRVDADRHTIEVRSASRVGRGDLGVNRTRIEAIRAAWGVD